MTGCNPAYTPEIGSELFLNQSEEKLLNDEDNLCYRAITGAVVYLA